MKLLFFSDIHGISKNLLKIVKIIKDKNIDKIFVLGDLYAYNNRNFNNNENVFKFLNFYKDKIIVIRGNCDYNLSKEGLEFPLHDDIFQFNIDNLSLFLTHGDMLKEMKKNLIENSIII